jgi:glutamyl-tRNA synthetase
MTQAGERPVRTRIAPAPSGDLHVGNVRTALFNWAFARRSQGRFLLRIEDTDASRASEEATEATMEILRWIGLDWDEGPGVGGPFGPYRQSERRPYYAEAAAKLEASGAAYRCYCTAEELAERNAAARAAGRPPGYDGRCRSLPENARAGYEAQGRGHVLRFPMPPGRTTWTDLVRGEITVEHDQIPDFTLTRSDGGPLYVLAAAVDDMAMGLTHIARGEDLLSATPRQLALYAALGHPREQWPQFAHLPLIVADDGKPLSKRNGEVSLRWYRDHGFLPEAIRNYLALLGWSLAPDRELFSTEEMVAAFDLAKVSRNPARFDLKKLEAINGAKIRAMPTAELVSALQPWLTGAGLAADPGVLEKAVPLISTRMVRLTEAVDLLRFLLVDEADFVVADADLVSAATVAQLRAAAEVLAGLPSWSTEYIEPALREALVGGLGLRPREAFGPLRVAVTGRRVSPPLFESLELLGRGRTLDRLQRAIGAVGAA